jgi:hypothetical protein
VWSDRDALIAELEVDYTRLDGRELTLACCTVFRLRDGLVADYRVIRVAVRSCRATVG